MHSRRKQFFGIVALALALCLIAGCDDILGPGDDSDSDSDRGSSSSTDGG